MRPLVPLLVLAMGLAAAGPVAAQGLGGLLPGRGYAVNGERGPYLAQVDPARISANVSSSEARAFAAEAGNRGEHRGLRLRMPETEAQIAALVAELDAHWPYEPRDPVRVHILASGLYAPLALPDGSILVPFGLLHQAGSDDELAYILGHELGHVRLGHFADDQGFREHRRTAARLGEAYEGAAALSRAAGLTDASAQRDASRAGAASDHLRVLMVVMAEPAWARGQEDEADALAFDLAEAAGFNALDAADAVFGRLQADFDARRAMAEAMEGQMNETVSAVVSGGAVQSAMAGDSRGALGAVWRGVRSGGGRRLFNVASGYFGQRHRTPESRGRGLSGYADQAYPERSAFLAPQDSRLAAIRGTAEYAEAAVAVDALQAAQARRREGDAEGALAEIARAEATRHGESPAIANEAAAIHADAGRADAADALYARAHLSPDQSLDGYVAHARMLAGHARRDRARAVVGEGAARFGGGEVGEKAFLPTLVAVSLADGREQEGMAYLRRCRAYEEERLAQDCTLAAMSPGDPQLYDSLSPEARAEVDAAARRRDEAPSAAEQVGQALGGLGGLLGRRD